MKHLITKNGLTNKIRLVRNRSDSKVVRVRSKQLCAEILSILDRLSINRHKQTYHMYTNNHEAVVKMDTHIKRTRF